MKSRLVRLFLTIGCFIAGAEPSLCQGAGNFLGAGVDYNINPELHHASLKIAGFKAVHQYWSIGGSLNYGQGWAKGQLKKDLVATATNNLEYVAQEINAPCDNCYASVSDYAVKGYSVNLGVHPLPWLRLTVGLGQQEYSNFTIRVNGSSVTPTSGQGELLGTEQVYKIQAATATYGASVVGHQLGLDWELSLSLQDTLGSLPTGKGPKILAPETIADFVKKPKLFAGVSVGYYLD
jgi:hypothetical protein